LDKFELEYPCQCIIMLMKYCNWPKLSRVILKYVWNKVLISSTFYACLFIPKSFSSFFYLLFGFEFLAPIFCTKHACLKRWWNWLKVIVEIKQSLIPFTHAFRCVLEALTLVDQTKISNMQIHQPQFTKCVYKWNLAKNISLCLQLNANHWELN